MTILRRAQYAIATILLLISSAVSAYDLTPLLNLKKPIAGTETGWGPMLNQNSDTLDNAAIANGTGINQRLAVFSSASVIGPSSFSLGAVALLDAVQVLTNKTIDTASGNVLKIGGNVLSLSGNTGVLATKSGTWTLDHLANIVDGGVIPGAGTSPPFSDAGVLLQNSLDATKQARFSLSGLTTGLTRVYSLPDVTGDTLALLAATQTLTNKTLDSATNTLKIAGRTITSIGGNAAKVAAQSGSLTSGRLTRADINGNIVDGLIALDAKSGNTTTAMTGSGSFTLNNCAKFDINGNVVDSGGLCGGITIQDEGLDRALEPKLNFIGSAITCVDEAGIRTNCTVGATVDSAAIVKGSADATKLLRLEVDGFTTATTRVLTPQNRDGTIADLGANVFIDHQTIDNQKELRLREVTANGTNYTGFRAPASLAADVMYDLPAADGTSGQFLSTNGSKVLSWVTGGGSPTANGGTRIRSVSSELITLSTGGATTDSSANLLPANSLIEAVGCRVTTTITTATDWSVGDTTTAARFSSANATLTSGTTSVGMNHMKGAVTTDAAGPTQAAAAKPGAGVIRCDVWYTQFTAPTS